MSVDLIELWGTMGAFAKGIVYTLVLMSLFSLTVAFQRFFDFSRSKGQVIKFAPKLSAALEANDLDAADRAVMEHQKGHLAAAYRGVFSSLKAMEPTSSPSCTMPSHVPSAPSTMSARTASGLMSSDHHLATAGS